MIEIKEKKNCCGCAVCYNICPKKSIAMTEDNEGFLYPTVDADTCINCGLCEKVCPVINVKEDVPKKQEAYLVQNKDEKVLMESTSGGAFTAIAKTVINQGGIVFGAAFDNNLNVVHRCIDNEQELYVFRNSKYVQSQIGDTFKQVKRFLNRGITVCYSGTPCQIEGLKCFLRKDYDNLILIDIVCHAVPSPLIWRKYLEYQYRRFNNISNVKFRDKKFYGYQYSQMSIYDNDRCLGHEGVETDPMLRAFFSNICDRPSCYDCKFKKRYRVSDVTIWDCFDAKRLGSALDVKRGITRFLIQSEKGEKLFDGCSQYLNYEKVTPELLVEGVREMFHSVPMNEKRKEFLEDANRMNGEELLNKYFKNSFKVKTEKYIRLVTLKLGIYDFVKNSAKKCLSTLSKQ